MPKSCSGYTGAINASRLLEVVSTLSNVSVLNCSSTSVAVADVRKAKVAAESLPQVPPAKPAPQSLEDKADVPDPLPEEPQK